MWSNLDDMVILDSTDAFNSFLSNVGLRKWPTMFRLACWILSVWKTRVLVYGYFLPKQLWDSSLKHCKLIYSIFIKHFYPNFGCHIIYKPLAWIHHDLNPQSLLFIRILVRNHTQTCCFPNGIILKLLTYQSVKKTVVHLLTVQHNCWLWNRWQFNKHSRSRFTYFQGLLNLAEYWS